MVSIPQIIGKINPKLYASNGSELLKEYGSAENIPADKVKPVSVMYEIKKEIFNLNLHGLEASHTLVYDSSSETLEPVYFFILDLMENFGLAPEKLIDNFSSSPGSGHFAELGQRMTIMQQQGSKILGDINTVLRSVLNLIYDLKEFKIRLQYYDDLKSKEKDKYEAAKLSLKQIWLDKVDMQKGNSSIKAMALGQAGFVTLLDAFLAAKDEKDVDKIDLNERVKRVLKPRINEFNSWIVHSGEELRKRYELEKNYLRSQINSLKLYSRWAKPYLKTASELEQKEQGRNVALVKSFNTIVLELTLLGKSKFDVKNAIASSDAPKNIPKPKKDYYSCVLVDFVFRGIPQRVAQQQHFAFGGKAEVVFKAYSLTQEELDKLDEELGKSDIVDVLKLIEGATGESLKQIENEINFFLEENPEEEKEKTKDTSNPFLALFGKYDKSEKKPKSEKEKKEIKVTPDNWFEKNYYRLLAAREAADKTFNLFDYYKKGHGMESFT